jgi:SLT domain-containing protein
MRVYAAINAVQKALAISGITKTQTNTFDGYKFRGIDDVYNALAPLLAEHGLCILPRMMSRTVIERMTDKNKALFYVTVEAEFDFVSVEDGSKHTVKTFGEAMDRGDKATNKAMSAAYKYAAFQSFVIPTEGDEGDSESPTVKFASPVKSSLQGVQVDDDERKGLAIIANALIDLVDQEDNEKADNAYKIWELVEPIQASEKSLVLWDLLKGMSRVRSRVKSVAAQMRAAAK